MSSVYDDIAAEALADWRAERPVPDRPTLVDVADDDHADRCCVCAQELEADEGCRHFDEPMCGYCSSEVECPGCRDDAVERVADDYLASLKEGARL